MRTLRILTGLVLVLVGVPAGMIGAARWLPVRTADGQRLSLATPTASITLLCAGALITALGLVVVCLRGREEVVLVVEADRLTDIADRIAARLGGAVTVRHRPPSLAVPAPVSVGRVSPAPVSPAGPVAVPVRLGAGQYASTAAAAPDESAEADPGPAAVGRTSESRRGNAAPALRTPSGALRAVGSARLPTVGPNVRWRGSAGAPYTAPPAPVPAGAHWPPMQATEDGSTSTDNGSTSTDAASPGRPARLAARAGVASSLAVRRNSAAHHRRYGETQSDGG